MAKKKPDPAAVAQRKQERVAFVQAHPNLAPEVARQRFYVQTRTEELSAAGKPVDKKALRDKFQSGQVSREGFYTPGDRARFNTGSGSDGSLADTKLTDPPTVVTGTTGTTGTTPPAGYRSPSTSYMAPQTTTPLGTLVPTTSTVPSSPTTTVPSSSTTIPITDTSPKTVLKTGNISGPNVRMGIKQAQPTKTPKVTEKTLDQVTKDMGITWNPTATSGIDPVTKLPDVVIGSVGKEYKTSGRGDSNLIAYGKSKEANRKEFKNWEGPGGEVVVTTAGSIIGARFGGPIGSAALSGAFNYAYNMLDPTDNTDSSGDAFKRAAIVGGVDLIGGAVVAKVASKVAPVVGPTLSKGFNKIFGAPTVTDDAIEAADDVARTMDYSPWSRDINAPGTASPKPPAAPKIVDPIARQQAADAAAKPSTVVPKIKETITKIQNKRKGYTPKVAPWADDAAPTETFYRTPLGDLRSSNAAPGEIRAPRFERIPETIETSKPLTSAERMENAAAVVARNSEVKPPVVQTEPVQPWTTAPTAAEGPAYRAHQKLLQEIEAEQTAQTMDGTLSLGDWKQIRVDSLAPETNTLKVVTPDALPTLTPGQKGAATRAANRLAKETANAPAAEAPTGAAAPRDFAADLRKNMDESNFDHDPELTAWIDKNDSAAQSVLDDWSNSRPYGTSSGTASGTTSVNNLSGISGQRTSRADMFGGNRFGRKSPLEKRGMFVEDAGAQPAGNLNPAPTSAANILEHKGIKYTVSPDNPMVGIQEGTGVRFTLRKTKSGKPGTPHFDGVDVSTGLPKLRTPRTKFTTDEARQASIKLEQTTRTTATAAKRAEGAATTEQILKEAQEKANAGATVTKGEFPMTPTRRGRMKAQYERDVASGKIQADEPFVYSTKAVTEKPVIGEGSIPRRPVTSLGTTKAPVKPMDPETFKRLSNDMLNRSNAQLSDLADSATANTQYDEIVAEYGQETVDKLIKSVRFRQQVADKKLIAGELDDVMGVAQRETLQKENDIADARAYAEWFSSREAQQMRVDNPALFSEIVNKPENVAKRTLITNTTNADVASTMPRSFRQSRVDVNDSLAQQRTALQGARSKEDVALGLNADKPTVAQVDAAFTDAGNADDFAVPYGQTDYEGKIAWADSRPSQPIRDTPWERSYAAQRTASADAAETIANGSDDEVLALAKKYEIPVSGKTPADVAKLRSELARLQQKSASGPGRTSASSLRSGASVRPDGVPAPVMPRQDDLISQGLNKEQIKAAYDAHRQAYQAWSDEAVMQENPFANQFRFAEAPRPRAKTASVNRTTVHPDGTPEPTLTELPLKLNEGELKAQLGKDGYTQAKMDAEIAANTKLRAEISAIRQKEAAAITKWNNEAVTTSTPKKDHWTVAADAKDDAWGLENRELLATNPEEWHAIRQGIEERRIAQHVANISTPEGEAARAGAAAENARMAAHRAELEMPAIQPDANVLQQEDWASEASRRFFGRPRQTETIPVARTPRSAVPEVSVADWETSVNQRFNNPSGNTPRLRRPGAPDRPFEAGEDTLGSLDMTPGQTGMSGAANDLAAAQARQSAQSGTSALSGYVDDVSESVQQLKAELGTLAGKLNSAKTQAQQRKITGQMRNIQDEINLRETSRISGEKDNYEYDLGLD